VGDIPECRLRELGKPLGEIFKDAVKDEKVIAVYAVNPNTDEGQDSGAPKQVVWLTRLGMIKRSTWADSCGVLKSVFQCYKLREDRVDEVVRVDEMHEKNTILFMSGAGYVLNTTNSDVPLQGRIAGGVKGIAMSDDDYAVASCVAKQNGYIVAVTNKGKVKKVDSHKIDKMVRYRKGLQFGGGMEKGEHVVFGSWVKGDEDLVVQDEKDTIYFIPVADISISERTGKWKPIPKLKLGKMLLRNGFIHRRKKNN